MVIIAEISISLFTLLEKKSKSLENLNISAFFLQKKMEDLCNMLRIYRQLPTRQCICYEKELSVYIYRLIASWNLWPNNRAHTFIRERSQWFRNLTAFWKTFIWTLWETYWQWKAALHWSLSMGSLAATH